MEGQSGDCPFLTASGPMLATPTRPQWRGSRETARSLVGQKELLPDGWPQWRGSRETARSLYGRPIPVFQEGAAMEGQSGDCPFSLSVWDPSFSTVKPQWRGSRETARSREVDIRNGSTTHAAMEGQSGDCPFTP